MTEKLIRKVWIAVSAAILWGCGDASSYTAVDGVMLGTTLHITADVQGVSAQELYAADIVDHTHDAQHARLGNHARKHGAGRGGGHRVRGG